MLNSACFCFRLSFVENWQEAWRELARSMGCHSCLRIGSEEYFIALCSGHHWWHVVRCRAFRAFRRRDLLHALMT